MQPKKLQRINLKTQVKEELQNYIHQLDLTISNKLPREEELASMMGVSRITLRSALDDMAAEGIIFRKQGRGTFVNPAFFEMKVSFNPVMHFSDMIRNSGYEPHTEILYKGVEEAGKEVAQALQIEAGSKVIVCAKIFYADHNICAMVEDYIPESFVGSSDMETIEKYSDSMFYFIYHMTGRKVLWDKVEIDVVESAEIKRLHEHIKKYGGKDKAFLLLKGINYDEQDKEVLYAREYIDTSILKFNQIRKRSVRYEE